jgi:DNA ligase-1
MKDLKKIFDKLQSTNGRIEKENILKENIDNEIFKFTLYYLLNPFITTGLSTKKINKSVEIISYAPLVRDENKIVYFKTLLDYIKENNTGRDIDIAICQLFFRNFENEMQDFIKGILTKSLKIGLDSKTVNKIYGDNFIPTFDVMLGTAIEKCKINDGDWFSIGKKLNGSRCVFYKDDLYTRSGKKYIGLEHIIKDLKKILINSNIVVDGELVGKNKNNLSDSENFQQSVGIANSKAETKEELKLVIFDIITTSDFESGKSKLTYRDRKAELENLRETIKQLNLENVEVVEIFYEGTDQSQIWKWLDYAEQNDIEGIMINLDTPYECKRTKNLMKVKKFKSCDIRCFSMEKGIGKYSETLGAILCIYKGFPLAVGSGFTDEQRNYYWNNPHKIIGKIVEIKYKEETKNKNGGVSAQFPIFQIIKTDKDEESYD